MVKTISLLVERLIGSPQCLEPSRAVPSLFSGPSRQDRWLHDFSIPLALEIEEPHSDGGLEVQEYVDRLIFVVCFF
jgi:hypothetical protein